MKNNIFIIVILIICINSLLCQDKTKKIIDLVHDRKLEIPYTINGRYMGDFFITKSGMYIGSSNGLFFSKDQGKTWKLVIKPLNYEKSMSVINADDFEPMHFGTGFEYYVYFSKLKEWGQKVSTNPITSFYINGDTIILGSWYTSIYLSYDNGKTWEKKEKLIEQKAHRPFGPPTISHIICDESKILIGSRDMWQQMMHVIYWILLKNENIPVY